MSLDSDRDYLNKLLEDSSKVRGYAGKYVAVYDGEIISVQKDRRDMLNEVLKKLDHTNVHYRLIPELENPTRFHRFAGPRYRKILGK